jgi:protein-S-isoprenylcysteine O-methyltransferase Ste14
MSLPVQSSATAVWDAVPSAPDQVEADGGSPATAPRRGVTGAGDIFARAILVALYALLTKSLLGDFLETGRVTGLLLLVSEFLVIVFTLVRRSAFIVDRSPLSLLTTVLSVAGPPLVRAAAGEGLLPDMITTVASGIGLSIAISGKFTLGRSFGIVPANRGVVAGGVYNIVRHPIYAGYLVTHLFFLIAHPLLWNLIVLTVADTALIVRALREERVLSSDVEYQAYCRRVRWHLIPGVF